MQSALLVSGVLAMAIVLCVAYLLTNHRPGQSIYDEIGRGGLLGDEEPGERPGKGGGEAAAGSPSDRADLELEIRQMLGARSERRLARGQSPLDLDAETARMLEPGPAQGPREPHAPDRPDAPARQDPGLVEEVRQLAVARNERRARKGLEPLDVEAEVRRTLAELEA